MSKNNANKVQIITFNEDSLKYTGDRIISTNIFRVKIPNIEKYNIKQFIFRCFLSKNGAYPDYEDKENTRFILVRTPESGTRIVPALYLDKCKYFNHEFTHRESTFKNFDRYFRMAIAKIEGYTQYLQLDLISYLGGKKTHSVLFKMNQDYITVDPDDLDEDKEMYGLFNECVPALRKPNFEEEPFEKLMYGNPNSFGTSRLPSNYIMNIPFMINPTKIRIRKIDGIYSAVIPLNRKPKIEKPKKTQGTK